METEEGRKERLKKMLANHSGEASSETEDKIRARREKEWKTKRISAWLFSKDCSGVMKISWREN